MAKTTFQYTKVRWGYGCATDCWLPPRPDDLWYFWDEAGVFAYGPYRTEEEANDALVAYARRL